MQCIHTCISLGGMGNSVRAIGTWIATAALQRQADRQTRDAWLTGRYLRLQPVDTSDLKTSTTAAAVVVIWYQGEYEESIHIRTYIHTYMGRWAGVPRWLIGWLTLCACLLCVQYSTIPLCTNHSFLLASLARLGSTGDPEERRIYLRGLEAWDGIGWDRIAGGSE
ncbi:hypothetical protein F5B20DRAFT_426188 [Whalleya microplaca]|nr:hypothetical protein F5B20DRAFT_426188 [Whalleya microplaca]